MRPSTRNAHRRATRHYQQRSFEDRLRDLLARNNGDVIVTANKLSRKLDHCRMTRKD